MIKKMSLGGDISRNDEARLAGLDLNLLVALRALLREQHVSRAARRLRVSQPAMSRSLARLRTLFDDPLLVRIGQGMELTPRAVALQPRLETVLAGVAELVAPARFDPAKAEGELRLSVPDIVAYMLVPPLLTRLQREAPQLNLSIVQWESDWRSQLERGAVDLTIGTPAGHEPGIYAKPFIENHWTCVLRKGHPVLRKRWTAKQYASLGHMMVSLTGRGGGQVDSELAQLGLKRRVVLRVPYTTLTPLLVAESDLVLTTAWWLAAKLAEHTALVQKPLPFELPPVQLPMVWHERAHRDVMQIWFRSVLVEIAASIETRPKLRRSSGALSK